MKQCKTDRKMQKRFERKREKDMAMHEASHILQQFEHGGFSNIQDQEDLNERMQNVSIMYHDGSAKSQVEAMHGKLDGMIGELKQVYTKGIELCNRTACQTSRNVYMWNHSTRAFYCPQCARRINGAEPTNTFGNYIPLCKTDEKKKIYETEFKRDNPEVSYHQYQEDVESAFIF